MYHLELLLSVYLKCLVRPYDLRNKNAVSKRGRNVATEERELMWKLNVSSSSVTMKVTRLAYIQVRADLVSLILSS